MELMRRTINITFMLVFSLILNQFTYAAIINVPADQPTIQAGIDNAQNGDIVIVDDGVYKGDGNVNIDFNGKQITLKSKNGADATIIDCETNFETRGLIFQNNETNDAVLDGFTIKNGNYFKGSGIYLSYASPTIKNCIIDGNLTNSGSGIYIFNADPIITECTVTRNITGIVIFGITRQNEEVLKETSTQPTITNSVISENSETGIYGFCEVNPTISNCTVAKNGGRGIIMNSFAFANNPITNCLIEENAGGGLQCLEYSTINIHNSIVRGNTAEEGGGVYVSPTSRLYITDCVIVNNTATKYGGGIFSVTRFGDVFIEYSTITQNSSGFKGGGVAAVDRGDLNLTNSIVWDNAAEVSHAEVLPWGAGNVIKSSNIKGGLDEIQRGRNELFLIYVDNIDEDPLFVNANAGDFSLERNSPAAGMGVRAPEDRKPFIFKTLEEENNQEENKNEEPLSVSHHGKQVVLWGDLKRK